MFKGRCKPLKPSGHYMYRTVVTICTASLIFSSSTFCPHSVFMCFVWIWEQTAIISLYSINWLVCITETECVLLRGRAVYIHIIQFYLSIFRRVPVWIPGQCVRDVWWTEWHLNCFCCDYCCFPLPVSFHYCSVLSFIFMLLLMEGQTRKVWESAGIQCCVADLQ